MTFLQDPFLWALISLFGLVGAGAVVSGKKLGQYPLFGFTIVLIFILGRVEKEKGHILKIKYSTSTFNARP